MISDFAAAQLAVDIKTGVLFNVFGFDITNSMVTGVISAAIFLGVFFYVVNKLKNNEYNRFVGLVQWAFEGMLGQLNEIIPNKTIARKIAPLAITIFFYVLISYWMSILPGLDSIYLQNGSEHTPILRSIAADLNFTFALAIISLIATQFYAIKIHGGIGNLKRYLKNPIKNPVGAFEGALEIIGEVSRYSALSLRLFGNCFAGEVLLLIVAVLSGYFAGFVLPLFMAFELFIGFIQAYVFFVLTAIFTSLAIESHDGHTEDDHSPADTQSLQTVQQHE